MNSRYRRLPLAQAQPSFLTLTAADYAAVMDSKGAGFRATVATIRHAGKQKMDHWRVYAVASSTGRRCQFVARLVPAQPRRCSLKCCGCGRSGAIGIVSRKIVLCAVCGTIHRTGQ